MKKKIRYLPARPVTYGPKHHFFGFNDLSPWDISGKLMLALETDFIDRMPTPDDRAIIGIIDLAHNCRFYPVAETFAWNFQQGCRLQWIPGESNKIIFNDRHKDKFVSVILDIRDGKREILPLPVYTISPDGSFALTVNFSRLHRLGGYGYPGISDPFQHHPAPEEDGIYRLDIATGKYELIISIADVASLGNTRALAKDEHQYLTHILFNRDGTRICFLHRWSLKDGGIYTRLIAANPDGSELYCVAEGKLSHFDWYNSEQIVIWGRQRALISSLRRRGLFNRGVLRKLLSLARKSKGLLRHRVLGDRYLLFTDKSGEVESIGVGILTEDGHCSFSPDSKWMLTDTYADEEGYRTLILYNWESKQRIDIGKFYSLPSDSYPKDWVISGMRCDLHPRWNRDGTQVCIDSVHEGTRQIYVVDVKEIVNRK
jgi:hypothetical protein